MMAMLLKRELIQSMMNLTAVDTHSTMMKTVKSSFVSAVVASTKPKSKFVTVGVDCLTAFYPFCV